MAEKNNCCINGLNQDTLISYNDSQLSCFSQHCQQESPLGDLKAILDDEGGAIRPPSHKVEEKNRSSTLSAILFMKVAQLDLDLS